MGVPGQRGKRIRDDGLYPPQSYDKGHVYIVDDIDPDAPRKRVLGKLKVDAHTEKCDSIRELFSQFTDYEIHSVRFSKGSKTKDVEAYWETELKTRKKGELLIIYFHGKAGGEDEEYRWSMSQFPRVPLKAYKLIEKIAKCDADSMILLDCYMQTRFTEKWSRMIGNTEIIMRPESMAYHDGKPMEHDKDFTDSLVEHLSEYVEKVKTNRDTAKKSIPQILAKDKKMYSNPMRTWLDKPKADDDKVIKRIKLDPDHVREHERLEFFSVQIQGAREIAGEKDTANVEGDAMADLQKPNESEGAAVREGSLFDDETFGDDDGVSDEGSDGIEATSADANSLFVPS